jgi:hypothetical protein
MKQSPGKTRKFILDHLGLLGLVFFVSSIYAIISWLVPVRLWTYFALIVTIIGIILLIFTKGKNDQLWNWRNAGILLIVIPLVHFISPIFLELAGLGAQLVF